MHATIKKGYFGQTYNVNNTSLISPSYLCILWRSNLYPPF